MRDLKFICAQPDDTYYVWQVHLWLESLKKIEHSDKAIVLVFVPRDREADRPKWDRVANLYPEAEFVYYKDQHQVSEMLGLYIPILRPYVLWRYFKDHPEMVSKAVFYCDCDVMFTEKFDISQYIEDDVCYVSDTNSYINATYFDGKIRDVLPEKLEEYKTRDVLAEVTSFIGVNRQIAEQNNEHSGGAQYFLKNIDAKFWSKMMNDTIIIRSYLLNINKQFFESENKGFQSWCADMWGLLWNLWFKGFEVKVIPEMGFAWAPDPVEKLETHPIYHNAGINTEWFEYHKDGEKLFYPCFQKTKYVGGIDPFVDPHLEVVVNHEESKKHCISIYAQALLDLYAKYQLNY